MDRIDQVRFNVSDLVALFIPTMKIAVVVMASDTHYTDLYGINTLLVSPLLMSTLPLKYSMRHWRCLTDCLDMKLAAGSRKCAEMSLQTPHFPKCFCLRVTQPAAE